MRSIDDDDNGDDEDDGAIARASIGQRRATAAVPVLLQSPVARTRADVRRGGGQTHHSRGIGVVCTRTSGRRLAN